MLVSLVLAIDLLKPLNPQFFSCQRFFFFKELHKATQETYLVLFKPLLQTFTAIFHQRGINDKSIQILDSKTKLQVNFDLESSSYRCKFFLRRYHYKIEKKKCFSEHFFDH